MTQNLKNQIILFLYAFHFANLMMIGQIPIKAIAVIVAITFLKKNHNLKAQEACCPVQLCYLGYFPDNTKGQKSFPHKVLCPFCLVVKWLSVSMIAQLAFSLYP